MKSQQIKPDSLNWAEQAAILAAAEAPFLKNLLLDHKVIVRDLGVHGPDAMIAAVLKALNIHNLRQSRAKTALIVALADLAGQWSLEESTRALSDFADAAIACALQAAVWPALKAGKLRLVGKPKLLKPADIAHAGLVCLGLGKLGGRELNYSSDVDLIFVFDERKVTAADGGDATAELVRVVQQFCRILDERTEDGYVARVDLRLRPDPNVMPVALSMAAAEVYYHNMAHTWERAAFTRARVVAGDMVAGQAFLKALEPWIWRRSLDFTAIKDIHDLRLHMADHFGQDEVRTAGLDIKRGPGCIREIEFMLQMVQLIHGGRQPALRASHTIEGLAKLVEPGHLSQKEADGLIDSYRFWRTIEHRLQMRHDEQTHTLPIDDDERSAVARLAGFKTLKQLDAAVIKHSKSVQALYLKRFDTTTANTHTLPHDPLALKAALKPMRLGQGVEAMVERWRRGHYRALRSPRAQQALENLMPDIFAQLSKAIDAPIALARLDDVLERLPSGVAFLELLDRNRPLLKTLLDILDLAPALGAELARQPGLLDAMLDPRFHVLPETMDVLDKDLATLLDISRSDRVETIARWLAEKRFQVGVHLIMGSISGLAAAEALARLADIIVRYLADAAVASFQAIYGKISGGGLNIIAMGSWGGGVLAPGSDLDMVIVFSGRYDTPSTGKSSLTATHYYNRLGQRLIGWLTAHSAYGVMAEVDTRLRPSGDKGLLAVTTESFAKYQQADAWTWEHMALTRARLVYGSDKNVMKACQQTLARKRDWQKTRADILDMRQDINTHKPPQGLWDMKLSAGGLVDLEFIVQALMLRHSMGPVPDIDTALSKLAKAGHISGRLASDMTTALTVMLCVRVVLRQCLDGDATQNPLPMAIKPVLAKSMGCKNYADAARLLKRSMADVRKAWALVFD